MNPKGKVALVTGGAHRVGKAITTRLAQAGAHVIINYNSSAEDAFETACEVEALGVTALAIQCDVSDLVAVERMRDQILEKYGGVDIIVNSASHFERMPFPTQDLGVWRRVTSIQIDGPFYICNELVPSMLERGEGAIVNIVDLSAWHPWPGFTAHAVGKAAVMALTHQLALELAPTVRVNAVAPGIVLPPPGYTENQIAAAARHTLLGRWGKPEDVAHAVHFLVEADYITGEVITVDGGERHSR
jgi:NAD(P)-dependent dehydrogenase (short-subunit alcohol dehydrogenase family)